MKRPRSRVIRSGLIGGAVVWLLFYALASMGYAQTTATREHLIKVAFLYNLAKFVEWRADAFAEPEAPLVICVSGKAAFAAARKSIDGKSVKNRRLDVVRLKQPAKTSGCHIVCISAVAKKNPSGLLQGLASQNTLSVSDVNGFTRLGGMVSLVTIENKIRFDVNMGKTRNAGLSISSKLLKLARSVTE